MPRTLRALVVMLTLTACDPTTTAIIQDTTRPRPPQATCDDQPDILAEIEAAGYTVDCSPSFPPVAGTTGNPIWGWTDRAHRVVYLWPSAWRMGPTDVRVGLYHELHHVLGGDSEDDAIMYSYCRQRPDGGFTLLAATPTAERCKAGWGHERRPPPRHPGRDPARRDGRVAGPVGAHHLGRDAARDPIAPRPLGARPPVRFGGSGGCCASGGQCCAVCGSRKSSTASRSRRR